MEQQNAVQSQQAQAAPVYNPSRIENYYDQVHKASWIRRTAGIFAGATLGILFGAAIGAVAAFIPVILGVTALSSLTAGAVLTSAAIYAGVGGFMGVPVAAAVGETAGAVSGGLAIREHQEVHANAQQPVIAAQATKDAGPSGNKYFSWRPAAVFSALCGGFGAMTAGAAQAAGLTLANGGLPLLSGNTMLFSAAVGGTALTGGAAIAATGIIFAMFGSLMGFKVGRFSNELSNFYTKILTDDLWKKKEPEKSPSLAYSASPQQPLAEPQRSVQVEPAHHATEHHHAPPTEAAPQRSFTATTQQKNLQPDALAAAREMQPAANLQR